MAKSADQIGGPADVALADVQQQQHRLLGQETKAANAFGLVLAQLLVAQRLALAQARHDALQDLELALVGFALGRRAMPAGRLQLLDAPLDHAKVGQHELEVELLNVPPWINRAERMRHRRVVECPHHVQQFVGRAQSGQLVGRNLGRLTSIRRQRRRRQVDIGHIGRDLALGLEHLGQLGQSVVRHLDHADVDGRAAKAAGLGLATRERVENGCLARPGQSDYRDLHCG